MERTMPGQPPPLPASAGEVDVGSTLGSFELVELLGKGAMGRVFRGRHVRLGREVAVKVLNPEFVARPDVVQRFFREARVVNDIDHEHIVEVTDFVEAPGLAYLVMELLDGTSLRELMKQKGRKYPPLKRILGIMTQLCDALEAAHDKGVVHRDLKPDNVFVVQRGGADFVKVLDFGVAKLRDSVDDMETSAGVILGTPLYMSPEQALGKEIDPRADVWSAGVVLYELLAGAVPFTAPSFVQLAMRIREHDPKPLPRRTPRRERIPPWLAAVVMRCLEKRPDDRYRSMAALGEALRGRVKSRPAASPLRRLAPALAALAAVAVLGAGALRLDLHRRAGAALGSAWSALARRSASAEKALEQKALAEKARAQKALAEKAPAPSASREPARGEASPAEEAPARPATPHAPGRAPHTSAPAHAASSPSRASSAPGPTRAPAAHAAAAPRPAAKPRAHVPTVELTIRSTPSGASVVRTDTGERLGRTPLRVDVPRKQADVWLKMTIDGYQPVKFTVDLRHDNKATITFKGVKKAARRR